MALKKYIVEFSEIFYKGEKNWVLTSFWNSLFVAFFLLPLGINLSNPFFISSIILGVIQIFRSQRNFIQENKIILLFPVYFLILCISLIYTENITDGLKLIQRSLSLLLFPIIFLFVKEDATAVKRLFRFMLWGLVFSFFINVLIIAYEKAMYLYSEQTGLREVVKNFDWQDITGLRFSRLIESNYTSLYILLVLSFYVKTKIDSKTKLVTFLILFAYLFLLSSRAAYLILFIISIILISGIRQKPHKYLIIIIFFLATIVFLNNPRIFQFYNRVVSSESVQKLNYNATEKSRIMIWQTSIKLIKEAPWLGYGIGDANAVLNQKYKKDGLQFNFQQKFNAHNQFLQTGLQTGMLGLSVLVAIFVILGFRLRRSKNEFCVFLILTLSLLFESMLVRFNGIVFLSIVIPLLLKKRSILSSRIIRNYSKE